MRSSVVRACHSASVVTPLGAVTRCPIDYQSLADLKRHRYLNHSFDSRCSAWRCRLAVCLFARLPRSSVLRCSRETLCALTCCNFAHGLSARGLALFWQRGGIKIVILVSRMTDNAGIVSWAMIYLTVIMNHREFIANFQT